MSDTALAATDKAELAPIAASADHVTRQEAARRACENAGIVWPGTILPPGTALYESGVEKLKNDRLAWRRLPLAIEVIGLVADALQAESRKDLPNVQVAGLRFRPLDGRLVQAQNVHVTKPEFGLGYGPHSLRQLVAQIEPLDNAPRGFSSALLYLDDQERAEILNKRLAQMKTESSPEVLLRTRLPHRGDTRLVRAALSEIYGSHTDLDLATIIGATVRETGDRSAKLDYKPGDSRSRFELIWPSEIPVETFVVGDVHYAGVQVTNSETGEGGVNITPFLIRARCANLTVSKGEGVSENVRHVGDAARLAARVRKALRRAIDEIEPLIQVITLTARVPVEVWSPAEALAKIARRYSQPQLAASVWKSTFEESKYPGTAWGLAASISEAAHKQETWIGEADWEKVASDFQGKVAEVVMAGTPHQEAIRRAIELN